MPRVPRLFQLIMFTLGYSQSSQTIKKYISPPLDRVPDAFYCFMLGAIRVQLSAKVPYQHGFNQLS